MDWDVIQALQVWGKSMALIIGAGVIYVLFDWLVSKRKK